MTAADWFAALALCLFLFALCVVRSRPRLLWGDELFGYRVLSAPTIGSMLRGWWNGADGGGLLYYLLARLWVELFGLSELTLRLFSTAGMCAALILTWAAARRYFSTTVVALAVALVYLTPATMLWQELNGRFYGLFLAAAAFACLMFLVTTEGVSGRSALLLTATAHCLLIGSHILGIVYSFSLLTGTLVSDKQRRRTRWPLYFAQLSGWLLLPISLHAVRASASIASGHFWTGKPVLPDFILGLATFGKPTIAVLALLVLAVVVQRMLAPVPSSFIPFPAVLALLGSLLLAQTVLFLKSQHGTSVYADRYLIPMSVGTVFLLALCLRALTQARLARQLCDLPALGGLQVGPAMASLVLLCLCAYAFSRRVNYALYPARGYPQQITALVPASAPIFSNALVFALLSRYDPLHRPLTPTNWRFGPAIDDHTDYSEQRLMANWKRAGYDTDGIRSCGAIFSQHVPFYALIDLPKAAWFQQHIVENRIFHAQTLATYHGWQDLTLWSVEQVLPGPPPC